jgi:hypothetical protein
LVCVRRRTSTGWRAHRGGGGLRWCAGCGRLSSTRLTDRLEGTYLFRRSLLEELTLVAEKSAGSIGLEIAAKTRALGRRIASCEIECLPRLSWLNMVEIEIGVMVRQCLDRRIADKKTLISEIKHWERRRNAERATIKWLFTVDRAREKTRRVYPPAGRLAVKAAA